MTRYKNTLTRRATRHSSTSRTNRIIQPPIQKIDKPKPIQPVKRIQVARPHTRTRVPYVLFQPINKNAKDFFASPFIGTMPETVYVLASGPNGKDHWGRIPKDAFIIAVNQAVLIRQPDIWMVFDHRTTSTKWWEEALQVQTTRVWARHIVGQYPCEYTFIAHPSATHNEGQLRQGTLRGGATISGCAIQAAYYGGAKKIILCGVDMAGDTYYDGGKNRNILMGPTNQAWTNLAAINTIAQEIQNRGVYVGHLSPTMMSIPKYED